VEQVQARHNRLQQEIAGLNEQIRETTSAMDVARAAEADVKNLVVVSEAELTERKAQSARLEEEILRLRNDPRQTQISLDADSNNSQASSASG